MAFSPCLHHVDSPFRQIRPALMLVRRSQRSPRPSSPLMTPNLASLGHTPSPSSFSATTERTMNTHGAPKRHCSAPNSPATARSAEPLGWQFHFIPRLPRDRAQSRQAGAQHHCQFKQFICLVSPIYWDKPVLPRFVNMTFLRLLAYLWPSDLVVELREMPAAATTDVELPVVATKATRVRTSSPRSSQISANPSQAKVAATAAETTGALLVAIPGRPRCALKARVT